MKKKMLLIALVLLLAMSLIATGCPGPDIAREPDPAPTDEPLEGDPPVAEEEPKPEDPEPKPERETISAGTHLVNDNIEPGRYRSDGGIDYWERLSGLGGELGDIIANAAFPPGSVYVDIKETDVAFSFSGSGTFFKIDASYEGKRKTSFGDGMYVVGVDIEPGIYRSEDGAVYWARLSGFSGEIKDIIANATMVKGRVVVEISPQDVGFQTTGAKWEKVD